MKVIGIYGVDLGTLFVKTSQGDTFSSGVSKELTAIGGNILKVGNETYRMGMPAAYSNYDVNLNKTLNSNIRACYIYALAKFAQDNAVFEEVRTALPFSQWVNEETVEGFKKLLNLSEGIKVELNGKAINITVNKLRIGPEGYTAYEKLNHKVISSERTLIVDIGSRTVQALLFDDDQLIDGNTENIGVLQTLQRMSEVIQTKAGIYIAPEDIPKSLYSNTKKGRIYEMTEAALQKDFDVILKKLETRWNFASLSIKHFIFIGGGSLLLKNVIEKKVPGVIIPEDAQTIAAKGMIL